MHEPDQPSANPISRQRARLWPLLAIGVTLGLILWLGWTWFQPAAQRKIVMSVGSSTGIYQAFAVQYVEALAQQGITLELRKSAGAVDNYQRLKDPASDIDVALLQSGVGSARDAPNLLALASVSYEPIWLFYRDPQTIDRIAQLSGKRIGVGQPGSGLRKVALDVLLAHGIGAANSTISELTSTQAADALRDGRLDAAFFIGTPEVPAIAGLLNSDLKLMNFSQADALVRRFPSLSKVIFPRGAINLQQDLPPQDVTLLSSTALLVAKNTLHPSLIYALLDTAFEVHGVPGFFATRSDFPNRRIDDFPMSDEANRYFKSGRPFLQNYLPFWLANLLEQHFVLLVPLLATLFALMQAVPRLIGFQMRSRLAHWYGEVKTLEDAMRAVPNPVASELAAWRDALEAIDGEVHRIELPQHHFNQLYGLKLSIQLLSDQLRRLTAQALAE
ncbi:TAXI family TRAP transporter solute-binding subunit [Actimicrobium sp. GrIS 1.19]|uniref:TAXI family TRAP transporter solute-binding subunit n=1 Tax=Actimicrobium sp. GrIS 1.19 TaxID=3071708 RepID=UPI002E11EB0E